MDSKKTAGKQPSYPAQIIVVLRLVASGYLLYLAFGLLTEVLKSEGTRQMIQLASLIVFAVAGTVLGVWSLKKLIKGEYRLPGETEEQPDEDS